jgi:DNA repair exonuclease SbcCD ATPase subunit
MGKMGIEKYREIIDGRLKELDIINRQRDKAINKLERIEQEIADIQSAQKHAQLIIQGIQENVHSKIANIVTLCLSSVFDDPYTFRILFLRKRNKTDAKCVFERDGLVVNPMRASGGGVVDVAAFALRLACLLMIKPSPRKLMVMDEPFKFVSEEYRDNVRMMIEKLADEFNVQFIMVTHIKELVTGKVVKL